MESDQIANSIPFKNKKFGKEFVVALIRLLHIFYKTIKKMNESDFLRSRSILNVSSMILPVR